MKTLILLFSFGLSSTFFTVKLSPVVVVSHQSAREAPATVVDTTDAVPLFLFADHYPEYPGGEKEMIRFIQKNIQYPNLAYDHGHEGTVLVEFIVDETGVVNQIKVLKGIGLGCDEAALEVFKHMPKWRPAVRGGKNIPVRYITPIEFQLF